METRLICGLMISAIVAFQVANAETREYRAREQEAMRKCQREFDIDDSIARDFLDKGISPESEEGKCMVACYLEELEIMRDGIIDTDQMQLENSKKWNDPINVALANQVAEQCEREVDTAQSKCNVAADFTTCLLNRRDEVGLLQEDD